jgi:hypothetical protein
MKSAKMNSVDRLLSLLLKSPDQIVVVGTGNQAKQMRRLLELRFRIRTKHVTGCHSREAPKGKTYYLICATPIDEAVDNLREKGIRPEAMLSWEAMLRDLDLTERYLPEIRFGLSALDDENSLLPVKKIDPWLISSLRHAENPLLEIYFPGEKKREMDFHLLNIISENYLAIRRHMALHLEVKERKLLFPSAGRCGGVSLTHCLKTHPKIYLRVDHEGFAEPIYRLLTFFRQNRVNENVLVALLSIMVDRFDCLGGNPFCFLMPYISKLPWIDFYALKVERGMEDHCESIMIRNFHYTEVDFVPNRITAAGWGEVRYEEWNQWHLEKKIKWYLKTVNAEIEQGLQACTHIVRSPLSSIRSGINDLLSTLHWPEIETFLHLNTIPKDRVYSLGERIQLYKNKYEYG